MDRFFSQQFSFPPVHVIPSMLIIELHPTVVLTRQTDKAWEPSFGNRAAPDTVQVLSLSINVYSNYALVKFQRGHPEGEGEGWGREREGWYREAEQGEWKEAGGQFLGDGGCATPPAQPRRPGGSLDPSALRPFDPSTLRPTHGNAGTGPVTTHGGECETATL